MTGPTLTLLILALLLPVAAVQARRNATREFVAALDRLAVEAHRAAEAVAQMERMARGRPLMTAQRLREILRD